MNYIELIGIKPDFLEKTASFVTYDKSGDEERDKYHFEIKEGGYQGISVSHCEMIGVYVLRIGSSDSLVRIARKGDCVY